MKLLALQPGAEVEQVLENTGFDLLLADEIADNPPPTEEELRILRSEVDKDRFYI
jgi:glutaconate CoA-transferase subunit B